MSNKLILGIDMAKKDFAAAMWVDDGVEELGTFANDAGGRQSRQEQIEALCDHHDAQQMQLVIEATGGYEAALVAYAYEQGWLVSMPNPKQVRDWAKGVGYRAKTDRVDARILAHDGAERNPPIRPPLAVEVSQLDSLLKRRDDLEQALQKERTRLSESADRPAFPLRFGRVFSRSLMPWKRLSKKSRRPLRTSAKAINLSSRTCRVFWPCQASVLKSSSPSWSSFFNGRT